MKRKLKHITAAFIMLALVISLTGCLQAGGDHSNSQNAVDEVLSEQMNTEASTQTETTEADVQPETFAEPDSSVDYDLTVMDGDMVYASVLQMYSNPDAYVGKTVKINGSFTVYLNDLEKETYYYACIIEDAMACCEQGMEFIWDDGSYVYPDDYPALGSAITVKGEFETYTENGYLYCRLKNAELKTN